MVLLDKLGILIHNEVFEKLSSIHSLWLAGIFSSQNLTPIEAAIFFFFFLKGEKVDC
jgi:hypothetical protein